MSRSKKSLTRQTDHCRRRHAGCCTQAGVAVRTWEIQLRHCTPLYRDVADKLFLLFSSLPQKGPSAHLGVELYSPLPPLYLCRVRRAPSSNDQTDRVAIATTRERKKKYCSRFPYIFLSVSVRSMAKLVGGEGSRPRLQCASALSAATNHQ